LVSGQPKEAATGIYGEGTDMYMYASIYMFTNDIDMYVYASIYIGTYDIDFGLRFAGSARDLVSGQPKEAATGIYGEGTYVCCILGYIYDTWIYIRTDDLGHRFAGSARDLVSGQPKEAATGIYGEPTR